MASTVIAGKPSNTVGNKDSVLVLQGSSVRVQWGNKFIDLIKNGKINAEYDKVLKSVDSVESIKQDGIYLVKDQVWINLNNTKVQLAGTNSTIYVSFAEAQDVEPDKKTQALKNIGFYYESLEEAKAAGISSGIVYILGDNKLYTIINGQYNEYYMQQAMGKDKAENALKEMLYIDQYSLYVDGEEYARCENNGIKILKDLVINNIESSDYSDSSGYKLYTDQGQSYLIVDNIIQRNKSDENNSEDTQSLQNQINILTNTIQQLTNNINDLYYGSQSSPILLMSGILHTPNAEGKNWTFIGSKKEELQNFDISRIGGKIETSIIGRKIETEVNLGTEEEPNIKIQVEESKITVTGVSANQYSSPYTINHGNEENYAEDGNGAHWFETRFSSNTFSVREFHQDNEHNNSWRSGWHEQSCRRIAINVFGYIQFNKSFKSIEENNQGEENL